MNKLLSVCAVVLLLSASSCGDRLPKPKAETPTHTPKVLKNDEPSYTRFSKRSSSDLVDELYSEMVEKNPQLKKLEGNIQMLNEGRTDSAAAFNNYAEKNSTYYAAANSHAGQIIDSVLRKKVKDMIVSSVSDYNAITAKHDALLNIIDAKSTSLKDLHVALKIVKTLAVIHKYQTEDLPSIMPIEHYLQQQNEAIKQADMMLKK
ncbi:hypothetical protein CJD36_020675 [Flavipsychrobacter stenotrophus]|uniref:DUF4142 domain-containing protein n=1 Tax=Flavipsychrobacter stenotrophus TaxID=2077091 RepID=A0A2S7SQM0_9BACT|nr:hypothetical protein [Flavipsychrobacter stenotrophus]PQJ09203.1 hypothetical protein CJD36_020675 [Flavipsychrobacter stenotrophus]